MDFKNYGMNFRNVTQNTRNIEINFVIYGKESFKRAQRKGGNSFKEKLG